MTELCQLMFRLKSGILATFFKISISNLFCPAFTLTFNRTILAPENPQNSPIPIRVFSKVSVTQIFVTSATINIFP